MHPSTAWQCRMWIIFNQKNSTIIIFLPINEKIGKTKITILYMNIAMYAFKTVVKIRKCVYSFIRSSPSFKSFLPLTSFDRTLTARTLTGALYWTFSLNCQKLPIQLCTLDSSSRIINLRWASLFAATFSYQENPNTTEICQMTKTQPKCLEKWPEWCMQIKFELPNLYRCCLSSRLPQQFSAEYQCRTTQILYAIWLWSECQSLSKCY
jgi:hypothetical protein